MKKKEIFFEIKYSRIIKGHVYFIYICTEFFCPISNFEMWRDDRIQSWVVTYVYFLMLFSFFFRCFYLWFDLFFCRFATIAGDTSSIIFLVYALKNFLKLKYFGSRALWLRSQTASSIFQFWSQKIWPVFSSLLNIQSKYKSQDVNIALENYFGLDLRAQQKR